MPNYKIDLFAENDRTLAIYVKDKDSNVVDVTGATGVFTAKDKPGGSVVIQKTTSTASEGTIGAANKGEIFFYLVPSDTSSLDSDAQYDFDVKVTLSSGKAYTVLTGVLNLKQPINTS